MSPIVTNLSISCLIVNEFIVDDLDMNEFINDLTKSQLKLGSLIQISLLLGLEM